MMFPLTRPCEYAATSKAFQKKEPSTAALGSSLSRIALAKYDGVCGIAEFVPNKPPRMLSRTGEDYSISCDFLLKKLAAALESQGLDHQPVYIMGEVWRPNCEQPKISGDFRQKNETIYDFQFRIFDMVFASYPLKDQPYYWRLDQYRDLVATQYPQQPGALESTAPLYWADKVELAQTDSPEEVARTMGPGFDGLVIWDLNGTPLEDKKARDGQAIKFKPNITVDVRCNGGIQGEGKHAGRLGALTFSYQGKSGSVGTGFSDAQRIAFWQALVAGAPESPSGQIIEVEAMGLTPDGNLREPRFKGIRFDKQESD